MVWSFLMAALASPHFVTVPGTSYYPLRLDDPKAVYLSAVGDGVTDDTAAIQKAVDQVQGSGIVFMPSGKYRITDTIRVWPGVRVIGCGSTRPTLFLAPHSEGYANAEKFMVYFAGRKPRDGQALNLDHPRGEGLNLDFPNEANPGTFYSAMSNVDIEIGDGNPMAVGVRGRYAQHCYLAHMDFRLGSAMAGIHDTGNIAEDLRFFGGRSGIITRTPSPGWQYTLMDSTFEGQSEAAIRTMETGLTLIRPTFRNVPSAVSVEPGHTEMLWMSDARLENVSGPAVVISRESSIRNQINIENVACSHVPTFASFRESGKTVTGKGDMYWVEDFCHGSQYASLTSDPEVTTTSKIEALPAMPDPAPSDVRRLPDPSTWVNVTTLGAKGDDETDDTAAIEAAIDQHQTLYFPSGHYRVSRTIHLKPDTVLIGLHPFTTRILIKDGCPAFKGIADQDPGEYGPPGIAFAGPPVPLVEAPQGGTNILTGIGLDTGGNNPAATAALWKAGANSMVQDVKFLGGHGSVPWNEIYNSNHSADPNPARKWDSQYPSLWVTDGGGGTFMNIWTASTFAQAGIAVTNTSTSGRIYELSSEHHVRHEMQLRGASNWSIYALQTEEERGESGFALPVDISDSSNILIANLNMYRVISMEQPFPYAVKVSASKDVRLRNVHCNSNSKASFNSLLFDAEHGLDLRQREFASLTVTGEKPGRPHGGVQVEKLAGNFFNISGGAVDSKGDYYFVDAKFHRILKWDATGGGLSTVSEAPLYPVNLAFDDSDNLMVVSYAGKGIIYSFKPGDDNVQLLSHKLSVNQPGKSFILPVTDWELPRNMVEGRPFGRAMQFASLDGSTFIPVDQGFLDGETSWGVKSTDIIRSFGLQRVKEGQTVYRSGESECETYSAVVEADGTLSVPKLFAEQGGEAIATDHKGNVYIGAGQIYIYDPRGKKIGTIEVPERPIQLMFGGKDGKTLFIAARSGLYSCRL
jgi:pectate lyase-like protein/SMP-30/gluconolaconase/LRE-like protein